MATTLPNGIVVVDGNDLMNPVTLLELVTNGFSNAIGGLDTHKRQPLTFRVATQTEKATLATAITLAAGDKVQVADTEQVEMWSGSAWKLFATPKGLNYAFAAVGINDVAAGVSAMRTTFQNGMVRLSGSFTFGSTTTIVSSPPTLILPYSVNPNAARACLGEMHIFRQSTGTHYLGALFSPEGLDPSRVEMHAYNGNGGVGDGSLQPLSATLFGTGVNSLNGNAILSFDIEYPAVM